MAITRHADVVLPTPTVRSPAWDSKSFLNHLNKRIDFTENLDDLKKKCKTTFRTRINYIALYLHGLKIIREYPDQGFERFKLAKWKSEFEMYKKQLQYAMAPKNDQDIFDSNLTSNDVSVITYLFLYLLVKKISSDLEDVENLSIIRKVNEIVAQIDDYKKVGEHYKIYLEPVNRFGGVSNLSVDGVMGDLTKIKDKEPLFPYGKSLNNYLFNIDETRMDIRKKIQEVVGTAKYYARGGLGSYNLEMGPLSSR